MRKVWVWGMLVGVALVTAPFAGEVHAGKKAFIKARINGKAFKARHIPLKAQAATATSNGFGGLILTGTKTSVGRRGGSVKSLTLGCSFPGLSASSSFPLTAACGGGYAETKTTLGGTTIRGWGTDDMIQVTIASFNGTRLVGTWSGRFERIGETNPGDPPATVEHGKFAVDLLQ
jgi:hypothetical protein